MRRKTIVFYADENLSGSGTVTAIAACAIPIRKILELVPRQTSDEEIISRIGGSRSRVLLTRDSDFVANEVTRQAIREHRAGVFYIASAGNLSTKQIALIVAAQAKRMMKAARDEPRPFVFGVTKSGLIRKKP